MNKCFMMPCHMHSNSDHEGFLQSLSHESFSIMHIEPKKLPVREDKVYEDLKMCREAKRYAMVNFGTMLTHEDDHPYHRPLKEN